MDICLYKMEKYNLDRRINYGVDKNCFCSKEDPKLKFMLKTKAKLSRKKSYKKN